MRTMEKGAVYGRDIATLATKAGSDAAEVLHQRASEGFDELRALTCQTVKAAV